MTNLTNNKTIGIIGGMGPDASARLYQLMIVMAREEFGARKNEEYPELVIYSLPVPDFISDMSRSEEAMFMIKDRVRDLSQLKLACLALACNTAHTTLVDLQQETRVPFVSIVAEAAKEVQKRRYKRVGLLASPTTIFSGVYQTEFLDKNIEVILPDNSDIEELGEIIGQIVSGEFKAPKSRLLKIADNLRKKKVEAIVLGCTELPLVFPQNYSLPTLNTLEILGKSLLKRYYKGESI